MASQFSLSSDSNHLSDWISTSSSGSDGYGGYPLAYDDGSIAAVRAQLAEAQRRQLLRVQETEAALLNEYGDDGERLASSRQVAQMRRGPVVLSVGEQVKESVPPVAAASMLAGWWDGLTKVLL